MNKFLNWRGTIFVLLLAGFIARFLAFRLDFAFETDVLTFQLWAINLFEGGPRNFYDGDFFSDYPPVYMYILYILGALRAAVQAIFGDNFWRVLTSDAFRLATFMPAILADLGIGYVIYRVTKEKFKGALPLQPHKGTSPLDPALKPRNSAVSDKVLGGSGGTFSKVLPENLLPLLLAAAWLFNPAIILISGVWGQVESVFVLMLLVSLIFMRKGKLLPAYVLFGLAVMTKPQSLFLGPVYLYSAFEMLQKNRFSGEAVKRLALCIGAGLGVMVWVSVPFGLWATVQQLAYGMGLYSHASVNAFNFWALIGGNWGGLDSTLLGVPYGAWGVVVALGIIAGALWALHVDKQRHDGRHFYLIVGAIFVLIFAFSVRMHERYLFAAIPFLLMYYVENRRRGEFVLYWAVSAVFFLNCLEVLRWANSGFDWAVLENSSIYFTSAIMVFLGIVTLIFITKRVFLNVQEKREKGPDTLKEPPPMKRLDYALIAALIGVYSVLAFVNLGDRQMPQTTWEATEEDYTVRIDLRGEQEIAEFIFLMGARHNVPFGLRASMDGVEWETVFTANGGNVFAWHFVPREITARYSEIGASPGLRLQEVAFRGVDGELIPQAIGPLFDEPHLVPERRTFMNSTYFDEIYHPRTGYEFVHRLDVYETTHPPLGKVFMAASIRAFGMTPFAWRLPGTLFGIFMIPLLYAFARKLLKSNNLALFVAFIFTFDFMLFSHTRLATIDTFVTFFVIAMYFFMYCYMRGIEKNSLAKSLVLLALCGAAMGLAVASKWQGVYGALGLPILFFPTLYKLYLREKRQAIITFFSCFGLFVALPVIIYVLSYIPFYLAQGGDYGFLRTVWNNQNHMFRYHSIYVLGEEHPFASPWWSWPLNIVPLFQYQTIYSPYLRGGMSSFGNPAVWWLGIPVTVWAIFSLTKKRRFESDTVFLLVAYAANFLPWVFITRLTFIYHYFPSLPFVVLLIGLCVKYFLSAKSRDYACLAYAGVVLALFILFYPVLSGMPVSFEFVRENLRWLPDWWFV
jgi:predicted membrane-bound dolichyl-phosphate-mannose-protein mannosyltransferase/Gpi18-like mannosyltransferase